MSAGYDEPMEYGREIDWDAIEFDPVMQDRALIQTEEAFDKDNRVALATGDPLLLDEETCSSLARIFDMLCDPDDADRRARGVGYWTRHLQREHRMQLLEFADDIEVIARQLGRELDDERYGDTEEVVRRHMAMLDALCNRMVAAVEAAR